MTHRLSPQPGEWIDRTRTLPFSFEGRAFEGFAGDTVTSALLANGQRLLGRSFKYHRPRGVLSAANHDANVLLQTADRLNVRGDVEPLVAGESYVAVNTLGGLARDRARWLEWLSPVLPVGFYYKAFHRPRWAFPIWERVIRRISGLGRVDLGFPRTRLPLRRRFCDCLVIGAGAAGLAAARVLAAHGVRVVLADENAHPGGSLGYATPDPAAQAWLVDTLAAITAAPSVTLAPAHCAAGLYTDLEVPLVGPAGIVDVHARAVLVATGAIEQPAVFHNNDLPGVMLASAARRLVCRHAVAPFARGVVLAGNEDAYAVAADLLERGLEIEAVLDLEDPHRRGAPAAALRARGVRLLGGVKAVEARGVRGELAAVACTVDGVREEIACDGMLMSVGWAPAAQLLHQARARFEFDPDIGERVPRELPAGLFAAGRVNGHHGWTARVADGEAAAGEILCALGLAAAGPPRPPRTGGLRSHPRPWFDHPRGRNFVDFDEDITLGDLRVAVREGFDNVELLKRYTTNGMGPSQGKHSHLNASRWLAEYQGRSLADVGTPTARPFYHPVPMGALAGRRVRVEAESPLNPWHDVARAEWMEAGAWRRPRYYRHGTPEDARLAEYRAVRERVGLIDVSTLGKFEIFGPDAARLLNLCYTSAVDRTAIGMTRYVVMCDHRGTIVDDGVAARLGDQHFYVTAGSGHALGTYRQLTQVAALCRLDVEIVDLTRQRAAINVAGPGVRTLLADLTPHGLGDADFPFLGVRDTFLCGYPVRLMRVGFVGEAGFEVHLSWHDAPALWRELVRRGEADGLRPFGVETQRLLRLEKGHVIVGQDTDGVMHPFETPLGGMVNFAKPQFLGRAALEFLRGTADRRLVGFTSEDPAAAAVEECHLVIDGPHIRGRVTSVGASPVLGCTVGLAVLEHVRAGVPTQIGIRVGNGRQVHARVAPTPFYDPDNARQREEA
ncbi:MAG: 2Fe-2S iron-sulfur cluster-binding protein [Gammaproteobacteria bacterium]